MISKYLIAAFVAISYFLFVFAMLRIFGTRKRQLRRIYERLLWRIANSKSYVHLCELEAMVELFYESNYSIDPVAVAEYTCQLQEAINERTLAYMTDRVCNLTPAI